MTLQERFTNVGIKHFKAKEFLCLGGAHNNPNSNAQGKNEIAPEWTHKNIVKLALVWDQVREIVDFPITMNSVYRNELYNKLVGGASASQHMQGTAGDGSGKSNVAIFEAAHHLRDKGVFKGGIGIYNTFVHIDVRGQNADWDNRRK